jgi:Tol biopolymer transport system component
MKRLFAAIMIQCFLASPFAGTLRSDVTLSEEGKKIIKHHPDGSRAVIFETKKSIGRGLEISPSRKYVAIVETSEGVIKGANYGISPRNNLVICDTAGVVLFSIDDDVRKLSWSPDGHKIVYITGSYYEGGIGFRADGLYVVDLLDGIRKPITKDFQHDSIKDYLGQGYDVNWSPHDSNVYVREFESCGGNYMYDTKTGKTRQVPYKGINFSPNGKYYLEVNSEDDNRVYETATNRNLSDTVKTAMPLIPDSWVPDRNHHLLFGTTTYEDYTTSGEKVDPNKIAYVVGELRVKEKRFYLYDVEQRRVVEEWVEKP